MTLSFLCYNNANIITSWKHWGAVVVYFPLSTNPKTGKMGMTENNYYVTLQCCHRQCGNYICIT